ncbi:hypothetical protein NY2A_b064L [Paramecium bursaria Chlorella virus NY2A]|uniref:Uncharacterized protein b064L n=1 Tax=Paramecium bursaria Chlorella virus NY2A TaxID=46021 RepID=A7IVT9_PBCVN|nr:hypothetical protein NY2A_b064L [Paramecium bursaria Chlorella virus NY2A]ABT14463.1 hypothetical protein NY2A_b064L [Paramecium bursaria Chlorella virus NY2A]
MIHHLSAYSDIHPSNTIVLTSIHVLLVLMTSLSHPLLYSCSTPRHGSCRDHRLSSTLLRRYHHMSYTKILSFFLEPIL